MIRPDDSSPRESDPETYDLAENALAAPPLPGTAVVAETDYETIDLIAADLIAQALSCVREFGDFHLALSGGNTPQPLYERLMFDPGYRVLPWQRTHLWIVDERCVPFDDPRLNYAKIRETIVEHADIPDEQVHPMLAAEADGDERYEQVLRETLEWREKGQDRLDFVLLGMGGDGHTASLFPFSPALHEQTRLVAFNEHEAADPSRRLTMTYPLINAARFIAVLATGAGKASMIQRISAGSDAIDTLPMKGIQPLNGQLKWFLDADAAGLATDPG